MAMKLQILFVIITCVYDIIIKCEENTCSDAPSYPTYGTCSSEDGIYTCSGMIPVTIPNSLTQVKVICFKSKMIINGEFLGVGWENVTYLQLYSNEVELADGAFWGIKRLKELHIHIPLLKLQNGVFRSLENLEVLSLNDCYMLKSTEFVQAMANESILPNLTHLYLCRTSKREDYNFDINESFLKILKRPIKILDFSDTVISSFDVRILDTEPALGKSIEYVNISHTYVIDHTNSKLSQNRTLQNRLGKFYRWENFGFQSKLQSFIENYYKYQRHAFNLWLCWIFKIDTKY
ncbi:hypothetical protein DPMN_093002 [Dreissena polymorpha]|uniref:Uncharacterized protein n=1 Tax=Dreissena polymorpha TaxID=45954 RepID=A0A9D4L2B6_DREPO|nr:hypothetical protein DPMN_093002 [Dreissena polymorpha]